MLTSRGRNPGEGNERRPLLRLFEDPVQIDEEYHRQDFEPDDDLEEENEEPIDRDNEDDEDDEVHSHNEDDFDEDDFSEEDQDLPRTPLLPLFLASHLDAIPVYQLSHIIRTLVEARCETTLSWDQLRTPQISQFLVKPIQEEILRDHFSKAVLYALITNCLQFGKESVAFPGNSGSCRTRAMVCELLAIKLLREFSAHELIDALSYDFYPLQGFVGQKEAGLARRPERSSLIYNPEAFGVARVSTLEVAIRAQSKRFLGHPLVVRHLEAIWAGYIVFHSAADSLHREKQNTNSQALRAGNSSVDPLHSSKSVDYNYVNHARRSRRTVTLYSARYASACKLSRLRVPRYRQFLSTCSLAILLFLFVTVLASRSIELRPLEIVLWLWCIGFTLDEVVGFTEQGFNLYIMSPWNVLDLGILTVLLFYGVLRIASLVMTNDSRRAIAELAYDVLAMDAILLFPRLFSVLDHYRYFSQLLIAFRMMLVDLLAILILISIACTGFFVAFALAFKSDGFEGINVVYALFQILMGFTPAAWDQWSNMNFLGRATMVIFMCITHFLVVTMLITVLTNSFMAIVRNAHDEHQFLFAVNTMSMVKSDALFSHIAPANVIAWLLSPLRYLVSFQEFVKFNRIVVKITHFPILVGIYVYEKIFLSSRISRNLELLENDDNPHLAHFNADNFGTNKAFAGQIGMLRRERSVATLQDQALNAVFRHRRTLGASGNFGKSQHRSASHVDNWIQTIDSESDESGPDEQGVQASPGQESSHRRPRRRSVSDYGTLRSANRHRSIVSEPEHHGEHRTGTIRKRISHKAGAVQRESSKIDMNDGDAADRSMNGKERERDGRVRRASARGSDRVAESPAGNLSRNVPEGKLDQSSFYSPSHHSTIRFDDSSSHRRERMNSYQQLHHRRTSSNTTILFNPLPNSMEAGYNGRVPLLAVNGRSPPKRQVGVARSPRLKAATKPLPIQPIPLYPPQTNRFAGAPFFAGFQPLDANRQQKRSTLALDLASDLGDNKTVGGGFLGLAPGSYDTQFAWGRDTSRPGLRKDEERSPMGRAGPHRPRSLEEDEEDDGAQRLSRLVLVRMNTLEAGFREVLNEVKDWRRNADESSASGARRKESLSENVESQDRSANASQERGKSPFNASLPGLENERPVRGASKETHVAFERAAITTGEEESSPGM